MSGASRWSREAVLHRLRQFWLLVPLVAILCALMLSDLGDFMGYSPFGGDPCGLTEISQSSLSGQFYQPIAEWALRYMPTPNVAIVYIDPRTDPADLLTNTCASRAFIARLVDGLNALHAHLIVIDKYYSADACSEQDKNAALVRAVQSSKVPIVVGQQTYGLSDAAKVAGCLALTPPLDFKTSKVLYGLTRLNSDTLKIPLRWPVFSDPAASQTGKPAPAPAQLSPEQGDTLSLVAAKAEDPNLESNPSVQKFLKDGTHPYTTFNLALPHITGMTALCSAEKSPRAEIEGKSGDELCKPFARPEDDLDGNRLSLAGKIVVIGEISEQDMHPFPGGEQSGTFFQANYIQALLDHRFLKEIPSWLTVACVILFVLGVYCLYWSHDEEGRPHLNAEQAGLASLAALVVLAVVSFLALVTMSYFTPLWAIWGAGVFVVFRYLEATGHHRSQHLLGQLTGHHHHAAVVEGAAEAANEPPASSKDER